MDDVADDITDNGDLTDEGDLVDDSNIHTTRLDLDSTDIMTTEAFRDTVSDPGDIVQVSSYILTPASAERLKREKQEVKTYKRTRKVPERYVDEEFRRAMLNDIPKDERKKFELLLVNDVAKNPALYRTITKNM